MRRQTALKIIGLLRNHLDRGYTILNISKKLAIGYRPAYNHIKELEEGKVIVVEVVGRAKKCSLNLDNAKSRHLLQELDLEKKEELYTKHSKLKNVLENIIQNISEKVISKLHSIVLFGSYAKGSANKTSDIDLLFMISDISDKETRNIIETECLSYQLSHNITVSPILTDINEFRKMLKGPSLNVGKEVRDYGISIYGSQQFWRFIGWKE